MLLLWVHIGRWRWCGAAGAVRVLLTMLQHLRGVLLLGCRQPWRLALQRLCSTTASPSDKRRELLYSGLEDDDEEDGDDDVDASSVLQEETMDVDGVKLDDETVQYMLDSSTFIRCGVLSRKELTCCVGSRSGQRRRQGPDSAFGQRVFQRGRPRRE